MLSKEYHGVAYHLDWQCEKGHNWSEVEASVKMEHGVLHVQQIKEEKIQLMKTKIEIKLFALDYQRIHL